MKEQKIMRPLLEITNGTLPVRKAALHQITDKACEFSTERHLLVKVINCVLYNLDNLVCLYVHKILVIIEPSLLIDEDYYTCIEGREIISNLSKAASLAHMISTMHPDVCNTTAHAFSVVASTLDIPSLLPFLKAICCSKKLWQGRHTGIQIVQQIAIMMGCAVLPHYDTLWPVLPTV
ncbi:hypothetical protein EV363DRAFT_1541282 [Boletus edulis]|nr:hypothetical protein EV363DRAFT_1541282 [Boletus edulis]